MNCTRLKKLLLLAGMLFMLCAVVNMSAYAGDADKVGGFHHKIWITIDGEGGSGRDEAGSNSFGELEMGEAQYRPGRVSVEMPPLCGCAAAFVPMWLIYRLMSRLP
jgi:hypothetical protein